MKIIFLFFLICITGFPASAQNAVFDTHVHLNDGELSLEAYLRAIDGAEFDLVGFGAMWFGGPNQALAGAIEDARMRNDALVALAGRYERLVPIATVHPYDGDDAVAELERVARLGVRVLKVHPHTQRFDVADPRVEALISRAGELGMVVLVDNAGIVPDDNEKLFNLALSFPETRFVFAHIGGTNFRFWNVLRLARTADGLLGDNIYFDISAIVVLVADSPVEDEFVWTLRNVGIDRVLLGSDYPQFSLAETVDALERLGLTAAEVKQIRESNARLLFPME